MAEVSFYILPTESPKDRHLFACKLIEKVYRSGCFCYVLTESAEQSQIMDDLLWTFRAGSFIPHQIFSGEPPGLDNVILIGQASPPENWRKIVFNLSPYCPVLVAETERVLEILDNSELTKEAGRKRYRQYQALGIKMTIYKDW